MIHSSINLKEWIHIDSIESLLNDFNQRLLTQELKFSALQKLCEEFVTKSYFHNSMTPVESELNTVNQKLDTLDHRTLLDINGRQVDCNQLLQQHSRGLHHIEQLLDTVASRDYVDVKLDNLLKSISYDLQQLRKETATFEFTDRLTV